MKEVSSTTLCHGFVKQNLAKSLRLTIVFQVASRRRGVAYAPLDYVNQTSEF